MTQSSAVDILCELSALGELRQYRHPNIVKLLGVRSLSLSPKQNAGVRLASLPGCPFLPVLFVRTQPIAVKRSCRESTLFAPRTRRRRFSPPSSRFVRIRLTISLAAPRNIIFGLAQVSVAPPELWMIVEYCGRGSLYQIIHSFPNPDPCAAWARRLDMATQAAKAVAFLHAQDPPYVHCDIKSPNYLVTQVSRPMCMHAFHFELIARPPLPPSVRRAPRVLVRSSCGGFKLTPMNPIPRPNLHNNTTKGLGRSPRRLWQRRTRKRDWRSRRGGRGRLRGCSRRRPQLLFAGT